ncbi:L,D-transpeptidase family protein [Pelagibius sp.]|uniref:L,D-transpeptidase family protein n=1 Tax=Pelagibius sp. TaxID=1931238 RepID=UPI003BB03FD4
MDLIVFPDKNGFSALWGERRWRCAVGRSGLAADKREGDGATPIGTWALRRLLFRGDRLDRPPTGLPSQAIARNDGWCDAPEDPAYNQQVELPYAASHEELWRDDGIYDLIVVLGHNDDPVIPGLGSAIFLHLARDGFSGTEGCVALERANLITLLAEAKPGDAVRVLAAAPSGL